MQDVGGAIVVRKPTPSPSSGDDWTQPPDAVMDAGADARAAEAAETVVDTRTGEITPARPASQPQPGGPEGLPAGRATRGKEVAPRRGDTGMWTKLAADVAISDTSPELLHKRMIEQYLFANTPEEILTPTDLQAIRDVEDVPLKVIAFTHRESEFEAGSPLYMNMTCRRLDNNDPVIINTGIQVIMGQVQGLSMVERKRHAEATGAEFEPLIVRDYTFRVPPEVKPIQSGTSKRYGSPLYRLVFP